MVNTHIISQIFTAQLTQAEFKKLSDFIYKNYGIKMPEVKKTMLQGRLQKRLKALGMSNFTEYIDYVFSKNGGDEIVHMIDCVSTNKTDFFREPAHFDYLTDTGLAHLLDTKKFGRQINVWSAGSSSGDEAYTLAIVLNEFKEKNPSFDFSILGTDISTRVLTAAATGIYREEKIAAIPLSLKRKYFLRSKDRNQPTVRVISELRNKTHFRRLNFMDNTFDIREVFDIIFCRNVLIYFDRETQEKVINKLCQHLTPGGLFFLGHSESITNFNVPLKQIKPTIFVKL